MRLTQRLFIIVFSFLTSAFSGYYFFVHLEKPNVALSVAGLIASGFFFGLLQGWLFGAAAYKAVKLGAFLGVLLLWIPPVVATYGFALIALPLLMAYAEFVAYGVRRTGNFRAS